MPPGIVPGPPKAAWLWRENHNWNKIREKLFRNKNDAKSWRQRALGYTVTTHQFQAARNKLIREPTLNQ